MPLGYRIRKHRGGKIFARKENASSIGLPMGWFDQQRMESIPHGKGGDHRIPSYGGNRRTFDVDT